MYIGEIDGGDKTPEVIGAMADLFGQEGMLRLE